MSILFHYNFSCFAKEYIMKENCWTKTLLGTYRYLENITGAIDKMVMKTALNSYHFCRGESNNVYNISNKIIDLADRKITLINLKVIIDKVLMEIPESDAKLLIERYVENVKCRVMAESSKVSIRTLFRKLTCAENNFTKKLVANGYTDARLNELLKKEKWILNFYDQVANKGEENLNMQKDLAFQNKIFGLV